MSLVSRGERTAADEVRPPSHAPPRPPKTAPPAFDDRAALQARISELELELARMRTDAAIPQPQGSRALQDECSADISERCRFLSPSPDVLLARARCGTMITDIPAFLLRDDDEDGQDPSALTPDEVARNGARRELRARLWQQMDGIYQELAGPRYRRIAGFSHLADRLKALAPEEAHRTVLRQIAEERAGLRLPPTSSQVATLSPGERFWRLWASVGDHYEELLARAVGKERARASRQATDGWSRKLVYPGECPP